jgi:serine/threonine-protein kinase
MCGASPSSAPPHMKSEVLALFREVADRSPDEREAYYAERDIDAALRAEVESLLRYDGQSGKSLHQYVGIAASHALSTPRPLTGRRIGVFEVQGQLGAGGMGEVYRARDTRLGRDVAIKILSHAFRNDLEHVRRFEREARILASLNHPYIGGVHGLEEVDGLTALVMELVEGETLAERLVHGSQSVRETLDIARQVAEALEAAHAQGIVHRDLKPANIKRRPDGTVKVLDFGLAKPLAWSGADPMDATRTGVIGGTPAYMSPEQARGEAVDGQTDVWSFGVVLFELLTGVSPFARDTTAETLAAIFSDAPDYSLLPPETPTRVRHLLRRCLEKDRRRRLKHIGDARLELEDALSHPEVDVSSSPRYPGAPAVPRAQRVRGAAIAGVALAAGVAGGALLLAPRRAPSPVVRTVVMADPFASGTDRSLAFTPDGSRLGYITRDARQMFVRPLDALEPVPILSTAAYIKGMFASPDSRWFGFVENNFTLRKIPVTGGAPVTVLTMDGPSRGAAWGTDDTIVFATGASDTGVQRVSSSGGPVTVLTRPDHARGEFDHVQPAWLPGGRGVLFTIRPAQGGLDAAKVAVLDLATGVTRTVLEGGFGARYVDSGHLVYAAADALWAVRFDPVRLETGGAPVKVLSSVVIDATGATSEVDVASNGTLAYARGTSLHEDPVVLVWVDRTGRETPLPVPPGSYRHLRIAPDGTRVAISLQSQGEIYVWELMRPWPSATRMTFASENDWFPVWSPDARRLVFGSWRGGGFSNLYALDLESGSTERLTGSPDMQLPTAITPDGKTLVFHSFTKSLQALRLEPGAEPMTLVESPLEERNAALSPDGRWLAYEAESTTVPGRLDIYVRPFPDVNRGLWQVTSEGGTFPLWSRDGRELYYVTLDNAIVAVPVDGSATTWQAGTPTTLFHREYFVRDGSLGRQYDVAPDGRFLMLKREAGTEASHFVIVQNWVAELARQVR